MSSKIHTLIGFLLFAFTVALIAASMLKNLPNINLISG